MRWIEMKTLSVILLLAGLCSAQTTQPEIDQQRVDAAMEKLREKQQQQQPALLAEMAAMRLKIAQLAAQVAAMTTENEKLRQQLKPAPVADSKELKIGMTLLEADAAMGRRGVMKVETTAGATYEWRFEGSFEGGRPVSNGSSYYADFQNGKVVRHFKR